MIEKQTQHAKIIDLCSDGLYHCQNEFRNLFIFSPHKRRSEIEKKGQYKFIARRCAHGIRGQFDYLMKEVKTPIFYTELQLAARPNLKAEQFLKDFPSKPLIKENKLF